MPQVVVVTGAGGLIGAAVVRALVARNEAEIRPLVGPVHDMFAHCLLASRSSAGRLPTRRC